MVTLRTHYTPNSSRECPVCRKSVVGPANQVYCSRKCQQGINNEFAREIRHRIKPVHNCLQTNYRALHGVLGSRNHVLTERDILLGQGYGFNFYTHLARDANGRLFQVVYDIGWTRIKSGKILIKKFNPHEQLDAR